MKKLTITIPIVFLCSFLLCQTTDTGLGQITENTKTGRRLIGHNPLNYGPIGVNAIDLSYSDDPSELFGARGDNSFATGYKTSAERYYCTAMGIYTEALGDKTTAMGEYSTASGNVATAIGSYTIASGKFSTSMGRYTYSEGYATTAIGSFNTVDNNAIAGSFSATNRAFVIGNGNTSNNRSDALTVLFDGTTTIAGDVSASSFSGDGSGLSNVPSDGLQRVIESSINGYRLYPLNSYKGIIGDGAIDMSYADENSNGLYNGATGFHSFATGVGTTASGRSSTAIGEKTDAYGPWSIALGFLSSAGGNSSVALGLNSSAIGDFSTSMGRNTSSEGYAATAIGSYNTIDNNATGNAFSPSNRAFVIGNGGHDIFVTRSDAMTVLFDGTTTIAGDLTVNSDKRLKSNILSLGSTISQLGFLDAKTYTLKTNESKSKIGLLAQDVQNVFPQLVHESKGDEKILSINYQGLIPVLINAVNEQQETIDEQQVQIDKLTEMVMALAKK